MPVVGLPIAAFKKAMPVFSVGLGREKLVATQHISDRESKVSETKCVHPRYLPPEREAPLVWRPQPRGAGYGTDESGAAVLGCGRV